MVKFGVQLWQEEFDFDGLKKAWREVEEMGYDSAWIYDHFYPMSQETSKYILEAWTIMASLATETNRLRLGVLVTCNSYRFPSVLAKIAATVDVISKGRLEFGIGAGWHREEYDAYGIPFPDAKIRIEQLAEALELIKRIWTQERASFQGRYYTITDLFSYPKPLQKPHPPIWIGGKGDKLLRVVVAQYADYANFAACSVEEFRQRLNVLRRRCMELGRDFSYIRYNVVNLRARERVYLGKYAERKAEKIDLVISIYQLTPRAYLAILLHRIGPNEFLEKSSTAQDLECPSRFLG